MISGLIRSRFTRGKNLKRADPVTPEKPAYFRYLTIMAMHVFLQERVSSLMRR